MYPPGASSDFDRGLVAIDGDTMQPLSEDKRYFAMARMSPKGRFAAVVQRAWRDRVLIFDTNRQTFSLLTSSATDSESMPVWSRDGTQIAFAVATGPKAGVHVAPFEGGAAPTPLYLSGELPIPTSFTPDRRLLFEGAPCR